MPIQSAPFCEGTEEARIEVRDYLTKILKGTETEEEIAISLHETSKGRLGREIEAYTIGFDADELDRKVKEIVDDASREALVLRGRVKFTVRVEGRRTTLLFGLDVPSSGDEEDEESEDLDDMDAPNKRGLINQAQRFAENAHKELRLGAKGQRDLLKDQRIEMQYLRAENRELREANRSMLRLEQDLHNMKHARELDWRKQEKAEERKDKFLSTVGPMLPALGASILGVDPKLLMAMTSPPPQAAPPAAPQAPGASSVEPRSPIESAAEELMASLSIDQGQQIAKIISTEQFGILHRLHTLISERLERDKARVAEAQAGANGANGTNGRASAYGGSAS